MKESTNSVKKKNPIVLLNEKIRFPYLDVVDADGKLHPKTPRAQALAMAEEANLDLLVIATQKDRVIAKILDYGKFKFEQSKKQKENRKNQVIVKTKEIKVKPVIGENDLRIKADNARKWLAQGDKVKFVVEARGRMSTKTELIKKVYQDFVDLLANAGVIQQQNKQVSPTRYETIVEPPK